MNEKNHPYKKDNRKTLGEKIHDRVGNRILDDLHVVGDTGNQLAGAFLTEIIQGKILDGGVEFLPDVAHNPLRNIVHQKVRPELDQTVGDH